MSIPFVRGTGRHPLVQLNPLVDNSDRFTTPVADQTFGVVMTAKRGRIDRAFTVNFNTLMTKLGRADSMRANPLNEAWAQLYEALSISNCTAVVSRLVQRTDEGAASIKWLVLSEPTDGEYSFAVSETEPTTGFVLAFKHLGCHNDGIQAAVWVESVTTGGIDEDSKTVHVRVADADGEVLFFFRGSTDPSAKDEYGRSLYLPDVVASQTDEFIVKVKGDHAFEPTDDLYGYTVDGNEKWNVSGVKSCFEEGGGAYTPGDYQDAVDRLKYAQEDFLYLASGGSASQALLGRLATLAYESNRQFRFDVPGAFEIEAAIAFAESLNARSRVEAHLLQAFWMPVKGDDPSGANPNGHMGASMLNVAMACRRNAVTNARGLADKHYPIAGRRHPIARSGMRQTGRVTEQQLNALARARINPVLFDSFSDGSFCVFRDQITMAPTDNSLRKLISVVDMSTSIDDQVTRFGKSLINAYPMTMAVKRMKDFLANLFSAAESTGWLVPSLDMNGNSHSFEVSPNQEWPYDRMDVRYVLRYDGAIRQIVVTQTLSR